MAVLIRIRTATGVLLQCDARCYGAKETAGTKWNFPCRCVCNGSNHGIGHHAAILNTRANGPRWLAERTARGLMDQEQEILCAAPQSVDGVLMGTDVGHGGDMTVKAYLKKIRDEAGVSHKQVVPKRVAVYEQLRMKL